MYPENYNPVQLLYLMNPGIKFNEIPRIKSYPQWFKVSCEMNGAFFVGQGNILLKKKKTNSYGRCRYHFLRRYKQTHCCLLILN